MPPRHCGNKHALPTSFLLQIHYQAHHAVACLKTFLGTLFVKIEKAQHMQRDWVVVFATVTEYSRYSKGNLAAVSICNVSKSRSTSTLCQKLPNPIRDQKVGT